MLVPMPAPQYEKPIVSSPSESPAAPSAAELLRRSLSGGRLGHAYLFQGDEMESLESVAIHFSQILLCSAPPTRAQNGQAIEACGRCSQCQRVGRFTHPDVTWVHPESKLRVIVADQTRTVSRVLSLRPTEADRKIAVIAGADRMNASAANAFLKTLEEPPANSVILLLTTDPGRVLETILSRCLRLALGTGHVPIQPDVRAWIAGFAAETTRSAKGLLPRYRLLSSCLEILGARHEAIEASLEAESPLARFPDADSQQKDQWETELKAAIEAEYRRVRSQFLAGFHAWLRDIWMARIGGACEPFLPEIAEATARVAARLTPEQAQDNLAAWERTQRLLHTTVQEALALEVGLIRLHL